MRQFVLLVIPQLLAAQALHVSQSTAGRGETGSFLVSLQAPSGRGPVSLQWELAISKQVVVEMRDLIPGSSAESAGKALACIAEPPDRDVITYRCVLAGGVQPIRNGPVAIVKYVVAPRARTGKAPVRIEKVLGVSKDLSKIEFPKTEGHITIR